jgi:lipopolysaccharide biosynthesis glycosyltransferase
MFFLLLESIIICEHLHDNIDVLVYTSTSFMNMIKQHHLYNHEKIKFEINDAFDTVDKACKARLDLFKLNSIKNYNKILYLDTDVIVKDDIDKIFRVCNDDVLYCLEEGTITHDYDYWGKTLFGDEIHNYDDKSAFTSGILLFNNCEKIKDLFDKINQDIINRPHHFQCHDQPYIVYNAFKHRLYNNTLLKTLAVNNDHNVQSDKVIHHFPGGPGVYQHKIDAMTIFLNEFKLCKYSFNNTLHIENDIWTCSSKMRMDIANFFIHKKNYKIAEIGSHKGYSTKILSKIFSKVYAVDNSVEWTEFNKNFNKDATNVEYVMLDIYKDSWNILPDDIAVSFIDAGHDYASCKSDIFNSMKQFKNLQYIIFDDYGVWNGVKQIVDELIENKIFIFERFIGLHDVPGPNGIVKDTNEGIICSISKFDKIDKFHKIDTIDLRNKTYTWENSCIQFLEKFKMDAFGKGDYTVVDKQNIIAYFGGRKHFIVFNNDYTEFSSTREDDSQIVNGKLLDI